MSASELDPLLGRAVTAADMVCREVPGTLMLTSVVRKGMGIARFADRSA